MKIITNMTFDTNEILNEVKTPEIVESSPKVAESEVTKLISELSRITGYSENAIFACLCILCQRGGTSKRAQGSITVSIEGKRTNETNTIGKLTLSLNQVRKVMTDFKLNFTLRQFARTYATQIYTICERLNIPGDLAKKITRSHPEVSNIEIYWLSNFQMDNPDCPGNIRELILEHYQTLFPEKRVK